MKQYVHMSLDFSDDKTVLDDYGNLSVIWGKNSYMQIILKTLCLTCHFVTSLCPEKKYLTKCCTHVNMPFSISLVYVLTNKFKLP